MTGAFVLAAALVIGFLWGRIWTLRSMNCQWRRLPLAQRRAFVTWNLRNRAEPARSGGEPAQENNPQPDPSIPRSET